jgi:hypothetical protein
MLFVTAGLNTQHHYAESEFLTPSEMQSNLIFSVMSAPQPKAWKEVENFSQDLRFRVCSRTHAMARGNDLLASQGTSLLSATSVRVLKSRTGGPGFYCQEIT